MRNYMYYSSCISDMILVAEDDKLVAVTFCGQRYEDKHLKDKGIEKETEVLTETKKWLDHYFSGERMDVCEIPFVLYGTEFQVKVWKELMKIPYGTTVTYGYINQKVGGCPQAVGTAVGKNPISILIPCHRVIGTDGKLHGYAAGLDIKRKLLEIEKG